MRAIRRWYIAVGLAVANAAGVAHADITIGVNLALTGPNASLGIPYRKGLDALPAEIGGEAVKVILLDDASDPSTAVRNARKLIDEDKVDLIIGPSNTPAGVALANITYEAKVPTIALTPVDLGPQKNDWLFAVPQPEWIWLKPILQDMKTRGIKNVGFIGFSDPWGDLCFNGLKAVAPEFGITIVADERYARSDTSVTGQILKVLSAKPDAIFVGGSGTPGALPHLALAERGWTAPTYATPAVFNRDFARLGGGAIEGVMAVTGPVGAWDQLPEANPIKPIAADFVKWYEQANGAGSANGFAAYAFDAVKLIKAAAERALKTAKPGTQEFRTAFRDEMRRTKELIGTSGIYNFKPGSPYGVDERSVVLVRVEQGTWKLGAR
jgi:branched-chain amino acid transport system substrate-binding protein